MIKLGSVFMSEISRRNFFKLGASAALGAALFNLETLPNTALAKGNTTKTLKFTPISIKNLPNAETAAKKSELINTSLNYIKTCISKITDNNLRAKTASFIEDTRPTFMQMYPSSNDVTNIYNKLADENLLNTSIISPEQLFPSYNGQKPQDFISGPGSGYSSHHPYPGGLCTHTAANLSISEGIVNTYKQVFGYEVDNNIVLSAQSLHDLAKPWVFQWNTDGTSFTEYTIAGTGAHHILSLVEAIHRNMPAEEIVAQACAHNHPGSPKDEEQVVSWIKAASIIAQVNPIKYGLLDTSGTKIPYPQHQEGYIVHLGDHDWVLSGFAATKVVEALKEIAQKDYNFSSNDLNGKLFNDFRNYIGAQVSYMYLHNLLAQNGFGELRSLINQIIVK